MIRPRLRLWGLLAAMLLGLYPLHAEVFEYSSDETRFVFAQGRQRAELRGNARIVSETLEVSADEIVLSGENFRFADATGNVRARDSERGLDLRAASLFLDRNSDLIRAEGLVEMQDLRNEVVARGAYLESRGQEDIVLIQIGVRILREDLVTRSELALYRRADDVLELSGFPQVIFEGDEYRASRIVIDLERDEIELIGEVEGRISTDEEEAPPEGGGTSEEGAAGDEAEVGE